MHVWSCASFRSAASPPLCRAAVRACNEAVPSQGPTRSKKETEDLRKNVKELQRLKKALSL